MDLFLVLLMQELVFVTANSAAQMLIALDLPVTEDNADLLAETQMTA